MTNTDKVKVAVRVRPFNRREVELGTKCVVDMESNQTILYHPDIGFKESEDGSPPHGGSNSKKPPKTFAFDNCFWSIDESHKKFANQETVFNALGKDILERAFEGYNACIFAYGQTGSGKSYSMMGTFDQKGIIPRLCDTLFMQIASCDDPDTVFKVEVSYMEIYNERVRDLLDPNGKHNLKVREHNIFGPYVDCLSTLAVLSFEDINSLMTEGNKSRTVAATNMNSESSRSHAVFNIILTATLIDQASGVSGEKVSKISLVDLAGSERAQKTGAMGERLREGSNINKSLTTLGLVISALADSGKTKNKFVPYRDSVLTWLLKDNLGGNSKTVMIATISPAADNYEETLSTLRYADRAKQIVNHAVVNEDPNARIIRELREEVDTLKVQLSEAKSNQADSLRDKLGESEKLIKDMTRTWEQKLQDTERIHEERQQTLEKMGISLHTSGIKVGTGKFFLVNLNADPSLNELLVYYLKDKRTLVGRPDAAVEQDIQLNGLGIKQEHAIIDIEENEVHVTPLEDARACINGRSISEKTKCKHGDRLLLGNYHFFRINCPKTNSPQSETPQKIDYDFAQQELMMEEMGNDPVQTAIMEIELSHERDKEEALQRQREKFEWQMRQLMTSPGTPSSGSVYFLPTSDTFPSSPGINQLHYQWEEERERTFKQSLARLKEEVVRANALVREANFLAQEMGKKTEFSVTLQIPAANLTPNRKKGAFVSEPAILVKRRHRGSQVWAMEKFEHKIIDMRDLYEDWKEHGGGGGGGDTSGDGSKSGSSSETESGPPVKSDPFYESQENHNLIGVANVFLETLFYDVKLDYHVPIISQQGEVAGRLHVELGRVAGVFPQDRLGDADSEEGSGDGSNRNSMIETEESGVPLGNNIITRLRLKSARGLPPALSNFVFCQYMFWGSSEPVVVPPIVNPEAHPFRHDRAAPENFIFDHKREYLVKLTEEFVEHCTDGALSIEVWGHRSIGFNEDHLEFPEQRDAKNKSLMDRWSEVTRKIEMWVQIRELNELGEYEAVEHASRPEVLTGGVFQLRQGHSRRIFVRVKPVQNTGTLPIIMESIQHVAIGCVCARSKLQTGLDSYQETDLGLLRERWTQALEKRRDYLDSQIQKIMSKQSKSDADKERERTLVEQWVCLTEERNAVLVPDAGSGIPGAPADWAPPTGMEEHVPVLFLDLNADSMTTPTVKEGMQAAGINSLLPKEHGAQFFVLPFVKNSADKDVSCVVSWDSSIHDSVHLNRITPANERVYLILKVVVRLSHPAAMELVLRKRICINVYKRQGFAEKIKKKMTKAMMYSMGAGEYLQDTLIDSGVTFDVVSNIPKASEDLEDRESLAQMAASQNEQAPDGETYIEKYIKGVSAVESILTLDRLRQEVAIKELMTSRGKALQMRKATSVPNMQSVLSPMDRLGGGSSYDLCGAFAAAGATTALTPGGHGGQEYAPERHGNMPKQYSLDALRQKSLMGGAELSKELAAGGKIMASPLGGGSPQVGKYHTPMKTLLEERQSRPLLPKHHEQEIEEDEVAKLKEQEEIKRKSAFEHQSEALKQAINQNTASMPDKQQSASMDSKEFAELQEYSHVETGANTDRPESDAATNTTPFPGGENMKSSSTSDSLAEVQTSTGKHGALSTGNGFASSVTSSGYGSQAVSMQTLSSEDSASIRSLDDQETNQTYAASNTLAGEKVKAAQNGSLSEEDEKQDGDMDAPAGEEYHVISDESNNASAESVVELGVEGNTELNSVRKDEVKDEIKGLDSESSNTNLDTHSSSGSVIEMREQNSAKHVTSEQMESQSGGNVDMYSEQMLDNLENLSINQCNDTFTSPTPVANRTLETSQNTNLDTDCKPNAARILDFSGDETETKDIQNEGEHKTDTTVASIDRQEIEPVKPRDQNKTSTRSNGNKRKSWTESNSEIVNTPIPEHDTVQNHKGSPAPSVDGDSSAKKNKKNGGQRTSDVMAKPGPQPMKATHRPSGLEQVRTEEDHDSSSGHDSDHEDDSQSVCSFGSRADLHRLGETPVPGWVEVGVPVQVLLSGGSGTMGSVSRAGFVQFVGHTEFATGNWVGVALDTPEGKNDGSVKGVRYFRCRPRHGLFVRHDKLIWDKKRRGLKGRLSEVRRSSGNLAPTSGTPTSVSPNSTSGVSPASGGSSPRSGGGEKAVPSYMRATYSSGNK